MREVTSSSYSYMVWAVGDTVGVSVARVYVSRAFRAKQSIVDVRGVRVPLYNCLHIVRLVTM